MWWLVWGLMQAFIVVRVFISNLLLAEYIMNK